MFDSTRFRTIGLNTRISDLRIPYLSTHSETPTGLTCSMYELLFGLFDCSFDDRTPAVPGQYWFESNVELSEIAAMFEEDRSGYCTAASSMVVLVLVGLLYTQKSAILDIIVCTCLVD